LRDVFIYQDGDMLQREEVQIEMVQGTGVAGKGISRSFLFAEDWLDWWNDWQFADSEGLFMGVSWNSISSNWGFQSSSGMFLSGLHLEVGQLPTPRP